MKIDFFMMACEAAYALIVLAAALAMISCALYSLRLQIAAIIASAKLKVLRRELRYRSDEIEEDDEDGDTRDEQ